MSKQRTESPSDAREEVVATYTIETPESLKWAAEALAGEQSTGTFIKIPLERMR